MSSNNPVPYPPGDDDLVPLPQCAQCGKLARPGRAVCDQHWGEQMVDAARAKLRANALLAVEALVDVTKTSTDAERVRAANSILDRAGLRHGLDVTIRAGPPEETPSDVLRERLERLQSRVALTDGITAEDGCNERAGDAAVEGLLVERRVVANEQPLRAVEEDEG